MGQSKSSIAPLLAGLLLWAAPLHAQGLPEWVSVDSANQAVHLDLTATAGSEPGTALINGHHNGDIQLVVPLGWTVRWSWRNGDSTAAHSLVVMAEREKLPLEGGRPALDNAVSRQVTQGLKAGQKDETTFTADQAGWYWILCGVPGHALKGEWISLKVDRDAKGVSVTTK